MKLIIASIILSFAASLSVAKMAPSTRRRLQLTRVRRSLLAEPNTTKMISVLPSLDSELSPNNVTMYANETLGAKAKVGRPNIYLCSGWWIVVMRPSVSTEV